MGDNEGKGDVMEEILSMISQKRWIILCSALFID